MENLDTFVEIGMKEASEVFFDATEATMRPGAVLYERIKPIVLRFLGRKVIRPLMSPRGLRYAKCYL